MGWLIDKLSDIARGEAGGAHGAGTIGALLDAADRPDLPEALPPQAEPELPPSVNVAAPERDYARRELRDLLPADTAHGAFLDPPRHSEGMAEALRALMNVCLVNDALVRTSGRPEHAARARRLMQARMVELKYFKVALAFGR